MKYIQVNIETKYFTQAEPVGTLGYDMIRGNAAYQWEFDAKWLHQHRQIRLSGDLQNAGGAQYGTGRLFGFLQDAMPDRLLISRDSNESSLGVLLSAAGDYMLSADRAQQIIDEVRAAMKNARHIARQCGISEHEIERFKMIFG